MGPDLGEVGHQIDPAMGHSPRKDSHLLFFPWRLLGDKAAACRKRECQIENLSYFRIASWTEI